MELFIILSFLLIGFLGFSLFLWSIVNYKQEKKLAIKHKYVFLIISILLLLISIGYIFAFISELPNATYWKSRFDSEPALFIAIE